MLPFAFLQLDFRFEVNKDFFYAVWDALDPRLVADFRRLKTLFCESRDMLHTFRGRFLRIETVMEAVAMVERHDYEACDLLDRVVVDDTNFTFTDFKFQGEPAFRRRVNDYREFVATGRHPEYKF